MADVCSCAEVSALPAQAHGNRTQWVLMADADMTLHNAWRLRAFAQRMVFHCELATTATCNRCFKAVVRSSPHTCDAARGVSSMWPQALVGPSQALEIICCALNFHRLLQPLFQGCGEHLIGTRLMILWA